MAFGVERENNSFFSFSFYTKKGEARKPGPDSQQRHRAEETKGKQKEDQLPALSSPFFFRFSSSPAPTQSPASSSRCAPHSAAEPSGEGGKELHTPSIASQIESLTINGNGVDHRRSGSEWAYQE